MITLKLLHNDFNITIISLLKFEDKRIDLIQSILQLKKVKNIGIWAIRVIKNLTIAFKNNNNPEKVNKDDKCFNYYKLGYFGHDCQQSNRKVVRLGVLNLKGCTNNKIG